MNLENESLGKGISYSANLTNQKDNSVLLIFIALLPVLLDISLLEKTLRNHFRDLPFGLLSSKGTLMVFSVHTEITLLPLVNFLSLILDGLPPNV